MCKRGDIYYADLGSHTGVSEQAGIRPVLIVSNDRANTYSPVVTIVPLTGRIKKLDQPTHVILTPETCTGIVRPSMALAEQIMSLDKSRLLNYSGKIINNAVMREITNALQVQIGAR